MIEIAVIDESAEGRNKIIEQIHNLLLNEPELTYLISEINLKSYSSQQNIYQPIPQMVFIGNETSVSNKNIIKKIRSIAERATLISILEERSLTHIEQLSRLGINDVIVGEITATEIIKRFYFPLQKYEQLEKGKIVAVDSGKGGVGITTVTAGFGEYLYNQGNKVVVIDLDWETQDLTRFLKVKPIINESLDLLLNKSRPLFREYIKECYQSLTDDDRFCCFTPSYILSRYNEDQKNKEEILLQILTKLVDEFDYVVIDSGAVQRDLLSKIYEISEKVLYVVDNNPASFYSAIEKLKNIIYLKPLTNSIGIIENNPTPLGIESSLLRLEINKIVNSESAFWVSKKIQYSIKAAFWPGSGGTILSSIGNKRIKQVFKEVYSALFPEDKNNKQILSNENVTSVIRNDVDLLEVSKKLINWIAPKTKLISYETNTTKSQSEIGFVKPNKYNVPAISGVRISS